MPASKNSELLLSIIPTQSHTNEEDIEISSPFPNTSKTISFLRKKNLSRYEFDEIGVNNILCKLLTARNSDHKSPISTNGPIRWWPPL